MGIFSTTEEAFLGMVNDILDDEEIVKLIYYDDDDPLSQAVVADTQELIYPGYDVEDDQKYRVYLTPMIPNLQGYQKTFIIPNIPRGNPTNSNFFVTFELRFTIITHVSKWAIKHEQLRLFQIMERINNLYEKNYNKPSRNYPLLSGFKLVTFNNEWKGYELNFRFQDWNTSPCSS